MVNFVFLVAGLLLLFCGGASAGQPASPCFGLLCHLTDHGAPLAGPPQTASLFDDAKKAIVADAQWSFDDATRHPDPRNHKACYQAAIVWLTGPDSPTFVPPHLGIISAIQIGFDVSGGIQSLIPMEVINACATTAFDAGVDLVSLFNRAGILALVR